MVVTEEHLAIFHFEGRAEDMLPGAGHFCHLQHFRGIFGANDQFKDTLIFEGRGFNPLPPICAPGTAGVYP